MTTPSQLQILTENYINADDVITLSSGINASYLYDQKPATKWLSSGSNDTVTETITVTLKNKYGLATTRTIDTIILNNTNAKSISVSTSLSGTSTVFATATGAAADIVITGTATLCDTIVISITTTQVANDEKYVGELRACSNIMTLNALTDFSRKDARLGSTFRTRDGQLKRWLEYQRIEGTLKAQNVTLAQRDILMQAIDDNSFLTFIFYGAYDLAEVFEFAVNPAPTEDFDRVTQLFEISLPLQGR